MTRLSRWGGGRASLAKPCQLLCYTFCFFFILLLIRWIAVLPIFWRMYSNRSGSADDLIYADPSVFERNNIRFVNRQHLKPEQKNVTLIETKIPKIIHMTWKGPAVKVSSHWQRNIDECMRENYDFELRIWSDAAIDTLIREKHLEIYGVFASYPTAIQRADAFRYAALYTYGGIYMDMDILCGKNRTLSDFTELPIAVEQKREGGKREDVGVAIFGIGYPLGLTNDVILASRGHPLLRHMLDSLYRYNINYVLPYMNIMHSTGPVFVSRVVEEWLQSESVVENSVFIMSQYCGYGGSFAKDIGSPYFIHTPGHSWHSTDGRIISHFLFHRHQILHAIKNLIRYLIYLYIYYRLFSITNDLSPGVYEETLTIEDFPKKLRHDQLLGLGRILRRIMHRFRKALLLVFAGATTSSIYAVSIFVGQLWVHLNESEQRTMSALFIRQPFFNFSANG